MTNQEYNLEEMVGRSDDAPPFDTDVVNTTQQTIVTHQETSPAIPTNERTLALDITKFGMFIDILSLLAKECDSMIIKNGIVCQMNNERKVLFYVDMTKIIGNVNIMLSNISIKEKLLIPFRKQQKQEIYIDIGNEDCIFRDETSTIAFKLPAERFLTNQYVIPNFSIYNPSNKVLYKKVDKNLIDRICVWGDALQSNLINVEFTGQSAKMKIIPKDTTNTTIATITNLDGLEREVTGICTVSLNPFSLAVNEYDMDMHQIQIEGRQDELVTVLTTTFGDGEVTSDIKIACRTLIDTNTQEI
jgi:hypothetical protein